MHGGKALNMGTTSPNGGEQRLRHLETRKSPQKCEVREPFLHCILTVVKKWVLYDNRKNSRLYFEDHQDRSPL
ncbi:hypothetical protein TNIN_261211 [Trichonephila inaurata madagascariensis]|uniref:Uncharacterized protein n=1 Tax=Trichonephila inaurata madagascariensis TaxID=2747483 RepID=A0A8X6IBN7_9ARAC|nr:hypothetical protein TNIN_261211 [Trichonephila inaurata madagascariensis]